MFAVSIEVFRVSWTFPSPPPPSIRERSNLGPAIFLDPLVGKISGSAPDSGTPTMKAPTIYPNISGVKVKVKPNKFDKTYNWALARLQYLINWRKRQVLLDR